MAVGHRMKRVIFLNRFFFPDHSATSQILSDLAFNLSANGVETHVITSRQLYDEPRMRLPREEIVRGVHIHRVYTTHFGRSKLWARSIDYLSFYSSASRSLFSLASSDDIVVAMTDPPLISVFAAPVARHRKAHLLNWLQDIFPEVAIQLNVPLLTGSIGRTISFLRDRSLKAARANVAVGQRMAAQISSRKIVIGRVHIIHNWVNDEEISPVPHTDNPLRSQWGLQDKFVVGYSGNLGRAHEFDTILGAAQRLRDHPRVVFVCIGGGYGFYDLALKIREQGLNRTFRLFPYQDQSSLMYSLGVADTHWISLRPRLEGLIVPSKFYGIAAAGRPIIAICAKDGEIAKLIEQNRCGIVIEPGDARGLAQAIVDLSINPERVTDMGRRARIMLESNFSRRHALARWHAVLEGCSKGPCEPH